MIRQALFVVAVATAAAAATPGTPTASGQKWYEKAVKKIEASFTPAEAKPGQTVTFSLKVELNKGYHTYPLEQVDKGAEGMVNEIKFPVAGEVIFVGKAMDPKDTKSKPEPLLKIAELRYCEGTPIYTRKAVVSPKAKAGTATIKLDSFKLNVCDEDNCFPTKSVPIEAKLKILDGPPVPVEKDFQEEVKKALGEK